MNIIHIIIGVVIVIVLIEVIKHLFFRKTAKLIMIIFVLLILFLVFSYSFKNMESFQDNKVIQTGAVITDKFFGLLKENIDTEAFVNSTVKSNKLFKS